jgi:hypothetical protein
MRKVPLMAAALAATSVCVLGGCAVSSTATGSDAGRTGSGGASTRAASGLFAYAPSWLRSSCSETGLSGHLAASVSGYSDSLTCTLRVNMPAEVDYYRYATTSDMKAAYDSASGSADAGSAPLPGGCATGRDENGKWSIGGIAVGDIACPGSGAGETDLIWDDPKTNIIAIASSQYLLLGNLYAFWRSSGASIDGSARSASSA